MGLNVFLFNSRKVLDLVTSFLVLYGKSYLKKGICDMKKVVAVLFTLVLALAVVPAASVEAATYEAPYSIAPLSNPLPPIEQNCPRG